MHAVPRYEADFAFYSAMILPDSGSPKAPPQYLLPSLLLTGHYLDRRRSSVQANPLVLAPVPHHSLSTLVQSTSSRASLSPSSLAERDPRLPLLLNLRRFGCLLVPTTVRSCFFGLILWQCAVADLSRFNLRECVLLLPLCSRQQGLRFLYESP